MNFKCIGLFADDKTWDETLTELGNICFESHKIREVFAMILCLSNPTDPGQLWEKHKRILSEDFLINERARLNSPDLQWTDNKYSKPNDTCT